MRCIADRRCTATSRRSTSSSATDEQLKLGDFGIATHQLSRRGVTADAFNLFNAPTEIAWGRVRRWQQRDDIYQVGLIAAMLLRGDIASSMRSKDVRSLPCSDHLKEVIHRCLGARGKRYEAAGELIAALSAAAHRHAAGTGAEPRREARVVHRISEPAAKRSDCRREEGGSDRAEQAGAVDGRAGARPPERAADRGQGGGSKLMEIRRLAARGTR